MSNKNNNQQQINITNSSHVKIGDVTINTSGIKRSQEEKKQEIIAFVSEGKNREGLSLLIEQYEESQAEYNQAILLLGRLSHLETQQRNGLLKNEDWQLEQNRIRQAILEMVQQL